MTLAEKLGQLTQFSNDAATQPDNVKIDQGELAAEGASVPCSIVSGAGACNALQRQAVEIASENPAAFRPGRDPRSPHGVPHPPRAFGRLGYGPGPRCARWLPSRQPPTVFAGRSRPWWTSPAMPAGEGSRRAVVKTLTWDLDGRGLGPRLSGKRFVGSHIDAGFANTMWPMAGPRAVAITIRSNLGVHAAKVYLPPFKAAVNAGAARS